MPVRYGQDCIPVRQGVVVSARLGWNIHLGSAPRKHAPCTLPKVGTAVVELVEWLRVQVITPGLPDRIGQDGIEKRLGILRAIQLHIPYKLS